MLEAAMFRIIAVAYLLISIPVAASAQETQESHSRSDASGTANDTTYAPVYKFDKDTSVGGYSSTTTTGGYQEGGSGQAIPANTRGSQQDTSRGIMFQKNF
jgi:hypothetical protein